VADRRRYRRDVYRRGAARRGERPDRRRQGIDDAEGRVVVPLDEEDLDRVVAAIRALGLDTVAVSLLFSFLDDAHERHVGERLRQELPGVGVFLSCEVLPEIREFERASTTAVCAYVGPLLASYLGRLDRESLLGGALPIDLAAAERAIRDHIARPLGLDVVAAAARVVAVVDSNMAQALRIVSLERGHDPRAFTLVAFGGAGPVHAAALADELAIPEIVVPPAPGAFSALGLITSDLRRDYARTLYAALDALDPERVAAILSDMETEAAAMLERAKIPSERRALLRAADLRYRRQAYELSVPMAAGAVSRTSLDALAASFHEKHRQTYGHANPGEPVQLVNIRLTALGRLPRPSLQHRAEPMAARRGPSARGLDPRGQRAVWFAETGLVTCPVLWRDGLAADAALPGPAVVEAADSTLLIPPGWIATVAAGSYIRLRRK
jgi:N-methylhydantoinase A